MTQHSQILASSCARAVILADRLEPKIEAFAQELAQALPVRGIVFDSAETLSSQWASLPSDAGRDRLLDVWEELGSERALVIDLSTFAGGLALPFRGPTVRLDPGDESLLASLSEALQAQAEDDRSTLLRSLRIEVTQGPEVASQLNDRPPVSNPGASPPVQRLRVAQSLAAWQPSAARSELGNMVAHEGRVSRRSTELLAQELDRARPSTPRLQLRSLLLRVVRSAARRGWPGSWRLQRRLERPFRIRMPRDLKSRLTRN